MRMFMVLSSTFTCIFIVFLICQLEVNERSESRLKILEAATYSAQQPLERNYFAGSSCDTVYIDHGTSLVYKGQCFVAK